MKSEGHGIDAGTRFAVGSDGGPHSLQNLVNRRSRKARGQPDLDNERSAFAVVEGERADILFGADRSLHARCMKYVACGVLSVDSGALGLGQPGAPLAALAWLQ